MGNRTGGTLFLSMFTINHQWATREGVAPPGLELLGEGIANLLRADWVKGTSSSGRGITVEMLKRREWAN